MRCGALSSGVAIIACGEGEARAGCTATSLASLSLAPPTLIVCLARSSSTLAGLREAGAFSINLLAARHQALAHRFSGHSGVHGARRFDSRAMDHALDRRPCPRRRDRGLRLPGRGGHRAPLACDRARRRREPERGRRTNRSWRAGAESMRPWFRARFEPAEPEPSPGLAQSASRKAAVSAGPAKSVQAKPNKTKQNQIEPSKIAWICLVLFVRIGAFQWVTANPNKKSSPMSHCVSSVTTPFLSSLLAVRLLSPDADLVRRVISL